MSTVREEVVATMGIDNSTVEAGLGITTSYVQKWVGTVKDEEAKYTDWWNTELKKREEMEVTASVRAASRSIQARKLMREREAAAGIAAKAEQAAANAVIGGGSMPAGWVEHAASQAAARELEAKAAAAVEKSVAKGVSSGVMREAMVLVREGFRGDFTRMFGSASKLLGMLGLGALELTGIGVVLGEVAGIAAAWWSMRKAEKEEAASQQRLDAGTGIIADRLKHDLANLEKSGRISHEQALQMGNRLNAPTQTGNKMVQDFIRKNGGILSDETVKEMARLDEEHQRKMVEIGREAMDVHGRITAGLFQQHVLKDEMAKLDNRTLEYKKKQAELDEVQRNLLVDQKTALNEKLELQRKTQEEQNLYDQAKLRMANIQQSDREKYMPTLDELAHHGRFTHQARAIERIERHIKRDYEFGNTSQADKDILERNKMYDSLADKKILPERQALHEIRDLNAQMKLHLQNIAEGKAALLVKFGFK